MAVDMTQMWHGSLGVLASGVCAPLVQGKYTIVMQATGDQGANLFCVEIDFRVHWLGADSMLGRWWGMPGGSSR